jgi:hypothetical protein
MVGKVAAKIIRVVMCLKWCRLCILKEKPDKDAKYMYYILVLGRSG